MRQKLKKIYQSGYLLPIYLLLVFGLALGFATLAQAETEENTTEKGTSTEENTTEKGTSTEENTTEKGTSCEANEECEWMSVNCCPENAGAEWECVNAEEFELDCSDEEDLMCPQVMSPKPEEPCQCVDDECQAEETDEDENGEDEDEEDEEEEDKEGRNACIGKNSFLRSNLDCCPGLEPYLPSEDEEVGSTSISATGTAEKKGRIGPPSTRGRCFAETDDCSDVYDPVCGDDGQTYPNECAAEEEDVDFEEGECAEDGMITKVRSRARQLYQGDMEEIFKEVDDEEGDKEEEDKGEDEGEPGMPDKVREKIQKAGEKSREHLTKLEEKLNKVNENARKGMDNFVAYGVDKNTKGLGAGERAAVVHSFESAFGDLPETEQDLEDMIKISNGRWPGMRSPESEEKAKEKFERIYDREPDLDNNPKDEAAVTVMAYGLRQRAENRNLESEGKGIGVFKRMFGHIPETTEDWNTMQAITYSGATK